MPWGYWKIDPNGICARAGDPIPPHRVTDFTHDYLLVGCEPHTMFKPGLEPTGFRWWWWDNSFLPHLRYPGPANPTADKFWSRLTYCDWGLPHNADGQCTAAVDHRHRERINARLHSRSGKQIKDIADIWGGCSAHEETDSGHALIILSSERNYKNFYDTTEAVWLKHITDHLNDIGWTYRVRSKQGPNARVDNQVTDEIREHGHTAVIANHSAGASEAAVIGVPVITTSPWNPARPVSTTWEDFVATGITRAYTAQQIDDWVTQCCAYTWHREELDMLTWIDTHPAAHHLRSAQTQED